MTPHDAYKDIRNRAKFMLNVYDGQLNVRKRSIRADWKRGFCRLMHWRRDIPIDRLDTSDALIILKENATLSRDDFEHERLDDFLRSALVMAVSALDRYVHERVVRKIIAAYKNADLTREQETLAIAAPVVIGLGKKILEARRQNEGQQFRPANIIRNELQEFLHTRPFQSWREISFAFSLIGIRGFDGKVQDGYVILGTVYLFLDLNGRSVICSFHG